MLENNIYSESKSLFLKELEAGNISEDAVVYIEDTKQIYTHGTYFGTQIVYIKNESEMPKNPIEGVLYLIGEE